VTAVIRDRVSIAQLSKFVPAACGEVWSFARAAGLARPGRHVALYLAEGWVEVGVEVAAAFVGGARVQCSRLPTGRTAHAVHLGPYGGLGAAHLAIRDACAARGLHPTGVSWEIYGHWQDSWNTNPAQIRTDVHYLLA